MAILMKVFETEFCSTKWDSLSQGQFARGESDINPKFLRVSKHNLQYTYMYIYFTLYPDQCSCGRAPQHRKTHPGMLKKVY